MRRNALIVFLICLVFSVCARALQIPAGVPSWKGEDKESLAKLLEYGDLVSVDKISKSIEAVSIAMLADAPPDKVWAAVTDFDGYTKLMPEQLSTKTVRRDGKTAEVDFNVTVLKLSLFTISAKYTLKYTLDAPKRADIGWVKGDVKNVVGFWELYPVAGGKKTVAIYVITSDLGSVNPIVGNALSEQPSTATSINLASAIIFVHKVIEKAQWKKLKYASAGSKPGWKTLPADKLHKLLKGGRVGFISRIGKQEIATSGVLISRSREKVWGVLTDFDNYPNMVKQVTQAKVLGKTATTAEVRMQTSILAMGPIKISAKGDTKYGFDKPNKMWIIDEKTRKTGLFNEWELKPSSGGAETMLFNSAVSNVSENGAIAKMMAEKLPALQISVDLAQGMIMANEFKKWLEKAK